MKLSKQFDRVNAGKVIMMVDMNPSLGLELKSKATRIYIKYGIIDPSSTFAYITYSIDNLNWVNGWVHIKYINNFTTRNIDLPPDVDITTT